MTEPDGVTLTTVAWELSVVTNTVSPFLGFHDAGALTCCGEGCSLECCGGVLFGSCCRAARTASAIFFDLFACSCEDFSKMARLHAKQHTVWYVRAN